MPDQSIEFITPSLNLEAKTALKEVGNSFPEFIANSPLGNTSFVYSVPVMGEWKNGNLQRMLKAMFSQRPNQGEAFEVEIIANIGEKIDKLVVIDKEKQEPQKDDRGNIILNTEHQDEHQKEALDLLQESNEAVGYLKKVIEAQRLAKILQSKPHDYDIRKQLNDLIDNITDPIQKDIVRLAIKKADSISLAVIDATHTVLRNSDYIGISISSLRTLGADIIKARFEDNPDVVIGMYDADTVPENNNAVRDIQQIFKEHPDLNYLFTGMTHFPPNYNTGLFMGDAPRENIAGTYFYNSSFYHGSPQISFRLRAYDKLKEISGWKKTGYSGFFGDEDIDTAYRLIYHFGALQDGLLLESSCDLYSPTSLTADRLDGSFDSLSRKLDLSKNGVRHLSTDLGEVFSLREKIISFVVTLPKDKQQKAMLTLQKTRERFMRKQRLQQRFNRLVLHTFLDALDKGLIKYTDGQLQVNDSELNSLTGGNALSHYMRANKGLIREVLSSSSDIEVMKYYLGRSNRLPNQPLSQFQLAIREYVGEVKSLDELTKSNIVTFKTSKNEKDSQFRPKVDDLRDEKSQVSIMHSAIAEMLALAHTYRIFFETDVFLASLDNARSIPLAAISWPENPDEQKLDMHYGELNKRLQKIRERMNVRGTEISVPFKSIPISILYNHLTE